MLVKQIRVLASVAALSINLGLGGCASLDAAAVAETHRLEEGEFYRDVGSGARPAVARAAGGPLPGRRSGARPS